jgi:hypothetical protein
MTAYAQGHKPKVGGNKGILHKRREERRERAEARQEKRNAIPHRHQLAVLARRPGNSRREVKRLRKIAGRSKRA